MRCDGGNWRVQNGGQLARRMQKIGLSFYLTFICLVIGLVVGVAMLAPAPKKSQQQTGGAVTSASADELSQSTVAADHSSQAQTTSRSSIASALHFIASPSTDARPENDKAPAKQTAAKTPKASAKPAQPVASQTAKTEPPKTPAPKKAEKPAAPKTPVDNSEEGKFRRQMAEAIAPLVQLELSSEDKKALAAALKAIKQRQRDTALAERDKIKVAAARKLVDWTALRSGYGRPQDFSEFLDANPMWPDQRLMTRRLEQALFIDGGSAKGILKHFEKKKPAFDAGIAAKASAHLALGNKNKAKQLAAEAWCGGGIAASREEAFLKRFGALLTNADHQCRVDRLLVANHRWTNTRKTKAHAIRRAIKLLDKKYQKKATARLAAFLRQRVATKWLNQVPAELAKEDWGFAFQKVQHLRQAKKYEAAWKLLKTVPTDPDKIINRDAWWEERHRNALAALRKKRNKLAYSFVADIRPESVNPAKDQAFFAGWVALRKLAKPKQALEHFTRMRELVDGPLSSSKAEFWLGRTNMALGNKEKAREHYKKGAEYRDTFHGQLSRQALSPQDSTMELPLPTAPANEQIKRFLENDAVQAATIAHREGLPRTHVLKFFRAIAKKLESEAEVAMLAQLANALGDGQLEVRTGKTGIARGFNMYIYSYPVAGIPAFKPLRKSPERALMLAIARQESEFNTRIVSGAGARGIMQVMPITARHVCRDYKIKCRIKDLLTDPEYNAKIASAYIADRTDDFAGSYILTFTGYNAGPGRTRQWLRTIGDPRDKRIEPLDWIYRIPFEETRKYTQKVLSNVQVYRARLGEKKPLRLRRDMARARGKS